MRTKLGKAIKVWTEYLYMFLSDDNSPDACNKLVDTLANLDTQFFLLEKRLDSIEHRLMTLEESEP